MNIGQRKINLIMYECIIFKRCPIKQKSHKDWNIKIRNIIKYCVCKFIFIKKSK